MSTEIDKVQKHTYVICILSVYVCAGVRAHSRMYNLNLPVSIRYPTAQALSDMLGTMRVQTYIYTSEMLHAPGLQDPRIHTRLKATSRHG